MTDLFFPAQAILDAYNKAYESDRHAIAAALRAAALCCKRDQLQLLAIADELEGH